MIRPQSCWSDRWINTSLSHFATKNWIEPNDPIFTIHYEYQQAQRARLLRHPRNTIRRIAGSRGLSATEAMIDRILDLTIAARG